VFRPTCAECALTAKFRRAFRSGFTLGAHAIFEPGGDDVRECLGVNERNPSMQNLTRCGQLVSRYGLVVVLAWIGFGKYVKMEARVLIEHSPLMSWIYDVFSANTVARGLGTMEIVAALLIALRPVWPRASAVGSALAIVLFLGTLSFLFTTPGVVATHAGGLPVLSALPGQFLLKDLVLIGVALWTLGDSLTAASAARRELSLRRSAAR
jgi:uncharacterized membrane protein YkgB